MRAIPLRMQQWRRPCSWHRNIRQNVRRSMHRRRDHGQALLRWRRDRGV